MARSFRVNNQLLNKVVTHLYLFLHFNIFSPFPLSYSFLYTAYIMRILALSLFVVLISLILAASGSPIDVSDTDVANKWNHPTPTEPCSTSNEKRGLLRRGDCEPSATATATTAPQHAPSSPGTFHGCLQQNISWWHLHALKRPSTVIRASRRKWALQEPSLSSWVYISRCLVSVHSDPP